MKQLNQYGLVRIVQLFQTPDYYDGWRLNRRPPLIGDIGTITDILRAPGLPEHYIVESSDGEGMTIWLGDFEAEELEPIDATEEMR